MIPEPPPYGPLQLCKNKAGYETLPARALRLDIDALEARLKPTAVTPVGNAGVLLLARAEGVDFSIFENGKLLFKTKDPAQAERALGAFRAAMGWG